MFFSKDDALDFTAVKYKYGTERTTLFDAGEDRDGVSGLR